MIQASKNVRLVRASNPSPMTLEGTNTYIVGSGAHVLLIDPGPSDQQHVSAVRDAVAGAKVMQILLTHRHPDHAEGAQLFSQTFEAPVAAWGTPRGVATMPIGDGARLGGHGVFVTAIHTPGHAADHVCFLYEDDRVLFSGDHILGRGTTVIAWPDGDMSAYMRSLEKLRPLHMSSILPGHGPIIAEPARVLAEYVAHRLMREQQVVDALGKSPGTPLQLVQKIYADVDPSLYPAAELSVRAHLDKLQREGRAKATGEVWSTA